MLQVLLIFPVIHFNSIKVQLEQLMQEPDLIRSLRFQFHKGTIRTKNYGCSVYVPPVFQFHKGTIRTLL